QITGHAADRFPDNRGQEGWVGSGAVFFIILAELYIETYEQEILDIYDGFFGCGTIVFQGRF
ncbi:MAG TPA: hypothetical protein VGE15_10515, partial [Sphingobacteriaceae bacterium]